jgi:hypothetical protein
VLVVDVPNIDSFVLRVVKNRHRHFTGRAHVNYFDPQTIQEMLRKAGIQCSLKTETWGEECSPSTVLQLIVNPTAFDFFSAQYFEPDTTYGKTARMLKKRRLISPFRFVFRALTGILKSIDPPFNLVTNYLKKGSYVRVYSRK